MKNLLIFAGLFGSVTAALGQARPNQPTEIVQNGEKNEITMKLRASATDTLSNQTRIISQNGSNTLHIETTAPADTLNKMLENVVVEQEGKNNKVNITSEGTKSNSVQIRQSGSNNKVTINQSSSNE